MSEKGRAQQLRMHQVAKELGVSSKVILQKCWDEGIDPEVVKTHMSPVSAGLYATIQEWFRHTGDAAVVETAAPVDLEKVQIKRKAKSAGDDTSGHDSHDGGVATLEQAEEAAPIIADEPLVSTPEADAPPIADEEVTAPPPARVAAEAPTRTIAAEQPEVASPVMEPAAAAHPVAASAPRTESFDAAPTAPAIASAPPPVALPARPSPAGPQNVPAPAKLTGPRVVRYESPEPDTMIRRPPMVRRAPGDRTGPAGPPGPTPGGPPRPGDRPVGRDVPGKAGEAARKGRVNPRRGDGKDSFERLQEWRNQDILERKERLAGATGRKIHRRTTDSGRGGAPTAPAQKSSKVFLHEPISMKEFCSAAGVNFIQVFKLLQREHNMMANINMTLTNELAELLALEFGVEVEIVPAKTKLDELKELFEERPRTQLTRRPPVVTVLGHVDHGKTSLLDYIRKTKIVSAEDGGITQHIGANYIETESGPITFLDTPGHEAFSHMRARGANLTDIAILVVAANDGIMPQTVEAISHVKAAGVPLMVALTKIDLGEHNKLKIFGQLSEHGLTPSGEWGGEVDVIGTSTVTGQGFDELLEHVVAMGELLDLKADATLPATGTVIEAEMKEGVGAMVRLLVQEGTLRVGDTVVCGSSFGKVRALLDDKGRRVEKAGPSFPVEVWGLDDVPWSGDRLFVMDDLSDAKEVAVEVRHTRAETSRLVTQKGKTLEEMFKRRDSAEVPELNVIIKADVDGSIAALKQTLGKIPSDEVRLAIRHAGVGPVNDSDVLLAATSDGLIIAYRVDTSPGARKVADHHGVEIRPYRVIYDVHDDVKKALEGLLTPEEKIEYQGRAEVRNVFNISKVGTIGGCYVVDGTIDRSDFARILRNGVVVRDQCRLASLKRFKDDAKEVRAGLECGIRIEGYDDLHVGDIIESYEIKKIARTL